MNGLFAIRNAEKQEEKQPHRVDLERFRKKSFTIQTAMVKEWLKRCWRTRFD